LPSQTKKATAPALVAHTIPQFSNQVDDYATNWTIMAFGFEVSWRCGHRSVEKTSVAYITATILRSLVIRK
jgi:hypothetical protein